LFLEHAETIDVGGVATDRMCRQQDVPPIRNATIRSQLPETESQT